jgi:hypothetical protein
MSADRPFFLSKRAHRLRVERIIDLRRQLVEVEANIATLAGVHRQFETNIQYYEQKVRPMLAQALSSSES